MKQLLYYLKFRTFQAIRALQDIGAFFLLFAAFVCFGFLTNLLAQIGKLPLWGLAIVLAIIPLSIHFTRKDFNFLKKSHQRIFPFFFLEYYILLLPLCLLVGYVFDKWLILLLMIPTIFLIAILPPINLKSRNQPLISFQIIPVKLFEWRAGFRKNGMFILLCYGIGLACSFHLAGPLASILIIAYLITTFFEELEAPVLLEQFAPIKQLINQKIKLHLSFLLLFFLPLSIAFLLFHLSYWYLLLIALLFSAAMLSFAIGYKYSVYLPHRKRAYSQNAIGFFSLGMFIPLFLPGSIYFLFRKYQKAKKRTAWFYPNDNH